MLKKNIIQLSFPIIGRSEEQGILNVLRSRKLAQGIYVDKFERAFASYIGVPYAVAVNNGTSALIAGLYACGINSHDEVITTTFTFGATANSILAVGAQVKFADIDPITYCLDPQQIEKSITPQTKALVAVDLFGHCADWHKLQNIANKHKLILIEDAAQAHGAQIGTKKAGAFADVATFSFYATKNMTTGEGGMITTKKRAIYNKLLLLRNHGMNQRYSYDILGFNFRMTDIQAVLGLKQLSKLNKFNHKRQQNAQTLSLLLKNIPGIVLPNTTRDYTHVFHQYVIRFTQSFPKKRDEIIRHLLKKGIQTAIHYPHPLHSFPIYHHPKNIRLAQSEQICQEVLSLPIHPKLTKTDLHYIAQSIIELI